MQTRKVSADIPVDLHLRIKQLALANGTTVAGIVEFGLGLAAKQLKHDPSAAGRLAKDNRLKPE